MKSAPLILISTSTDNTGVEFKDDSMSLSFNYPRAIKAAGGMPWVIPGLPEGGFIAEAVRRADGVLLTGGDDVQPGLYTEGKLAPALKKTVEAVAPERDLFELMLIDEVFRQRKPLLGICRGHQLLNVALGGTLLVDIPMEVPAAMNHRQSDKKDELVHDVGIAEGSLLARVVGGEPLGVNSAHHQGIKKIAKPLRANAVSKDGIIEGLELAPEAKACLPYLLTVQFHPERLFARHERHWMLFGSFLKACRGRGKKKYEAQTAASR